MGWVLLRTMREAVAMARQDTGMRLHVYAPCAYTPWIRVMFGDQVPSGFRVDLQGGHGHMHVSDEPYGRAQAYVCG